jgi:hypothetical protein
MKYADITADKLKSIAIQAPEAIARILDICEKAAQNGKRCALVPDENFHYHHSCDGLRSLQSVKPSKAGDRIMQLLKERGFGVDTYFISAPKFECGLSITW